MVLRVLLLVGWLSLPAFASEHLSPGLVKLVHQLYLAQGREVSTTETRQQLLQNQFLLSQAKQLNPQLLVRQSSVGFSTNYHVDKYLYHALQQWFPTLKQTSWQARPLLINQAQLQSLLGQYPNDGQYSGAQLSRWQAIPLVKQAPLTLAQVLKSQSMQNRYQLHQGDIKLLHSIVNQQLKQQQTFTQAKPLLAKQQLSLEQMRQVVSRADTTKYVGLFRRERRTPWRHQQVCEATAKPHLRNRYQPLLSTTSRSISLCKASACQCGAVQSASGCGKFSPSSASKLLATGG